MDRFPRILRAIVVCSTLAMTACSSGENKVVEQQLAFPPSQTKDTVVNHTAVLPSNVVPEMAKLKDEPDGMPAVEVVPESNPQHFSEFMERGRMRLGRGEMAGALADFEEAVGKRPQSANANIQLARTLLSMGEAGRAREYAEVAIELDAGSSLAWNTLGRVELAERDNAAAIVSFERAVEENADNSYAWNNLGFVYMETGDYEAAAHALEQATSGANPTSYMWNNLGMAYEHLDQITSARASYRQAVEAGSNKAQANVERLEGVISLLPGSEVTGDQDTDMVVPEAGEELGGAVEGQLGSEEGVIESVE